MKYYTGSKESELALVRTLEKARSGNPFSHLRLAMIFCGELCFTPRPEASEDDKRVLSNGLKEIKKFNVSPNYIKAYAHYILSDNLKANHTNQRKLLAEHMTREEIESAKSLAEEWKSQAAALKHTSQAGE